MEKDLLMIYCFCPKTHTLKNMPIFQLFKFISIFTVTLASIAIFPLFQAHVGQFPGRYELKTIEKTIAKKEYRKTALI
jgi:hypothetical protein